MSSSFPPVGTWISEQLTGAELHTGTCLCGPALSGNPRRVLPPPVKYAWLSGTAASNGCKSYPNAVGPDNVVKNPLVKADCRLSFAKSTLLPSSVD